MFADCYQFIIPGLSCFLLFIQLQQFFCDIFYQVIHTSLTAFIL